MAKEPFNEKRKFTADCVDYVPEPDMTFHDVFAHIENNIFNDMRGFETIVVSVLFEGDHGGFKACTDSKEPESLYSQILFACQMELWLRCDLDPALLKKYEDHEAAQKVEALKDQLYNHKCQDTDAIISTCAQLMTAYIDFIVDIADHVFADDMYTQLLWISAVNRFQDEIDLPDTPLKRMGTQRLNTLIETSCKSRKAEILRAETMDFEAYQALKAVADVLDTCSIAFQTGNPESGFQHIRGLHPGALEPHIKFLTQKHDLSGSKPPKPR